jgi:pimeloyl-ACP methyl ester carboxylesterase
MRLTDLMSAGSVSKSDTPEVAVSAELFAPAANGVDLCYQTFGDPDSDPLLLVMGLGGPMTWWDAAFCRLLAKRGFFVIRYDNRDTGRSTKVPSRVSRAMLVRAFAGQSVRAPYSMRDLAQDACSLLDHLGLDAAHLVGVSMGGMIAQTVAIEHPRRALSLTSISSTTGKRSVGWQHPRLLPALISRRGRGRSAYARGSLAIWTMIGSPAFPFDKDEVLARAEETFDRGWSASGVLRQMIAVLTQENRGPRLRALRIPALVVHGTADRMVHPSGGRATAAAIPGAELLLVDGLGHDLPPDLYDTFVGAIRRTADRAIPR